LYGKFLEKGLKLVDKLERNYICTISLF